MNKQLILENVSLGYGEFIAVQSVSLALEAGTIATLIGPSGSGKTTLLRAIAGFEPLLQGTISLHGEIISSQASHLPPESRRVGMVFQDFALFPHMNIARNIGFGLAPMNKTGRDKRVAKMLELVGLAGSGHSFPHELSGGEQQRVALARALAPSPQLLLMDEPFSNLDAGLRESLAGEVRQLLTETGITTLLVTHDQREAFAMAEQITLLRDGRVVQTGTARELYQRPADPFTAEFIGEGILVSAVPDNTGSYLPACLLENAADAKEAVRVLIRPDNVIYDPASNISLPVINRSFSGAHHLYRLALPNAQVLVCHVPHQVERGPGDLLPVRFDLREAVTF